MTATPTELDVREIPIKDLIPSPDNKRQINPKSKDIADLATSIQEDGVLEPLLARTHPTRMAKFDLRAGHRRLAAAKIAKLKTVPVVVREMDDTTARRVTATENLQREDLNVWEEADQLGVLIDAGDDVEAIHRSTGRDPQWIRFRANLRSLLPDWRNAAQGKGPKQGRLPWHEFTIGSLELVARLPEETQAVLFRKYGQSYYVPGFEAVKRDIATLTLSLGKGCGFDTGLHGLIRGTKACTSCPKREGARPELFEIAQDIPIEKDRCLDPACYKKKQRASAKRALAAAQEKNADAIGVTSHTNAYSDQVSHYSAGKERYVPAKKADKGAVQAVVTGGKQGLGRKIYIKPATKADNLPGSPSSEPQRKRKTVAEARKAHKADVVDTATDALYKDLETFDWTTTTSGLLTDRFVLNLVMACGLWPFQTNDKRKVEIPGAGKYPGPSLATAVACAEKADREAVIHDVMRGIVDSIYEGDLLPGHYNNHQKDQQETLIMLAELMDKKWKTDYLKPAQEAKPEPEEWKGLKATDPAPTLSNA